MSPEKSKILIEKYPNIFDKNFYFECEDGWYDIIDVLSSRIQHENEIEEARAKREGEECIPVIASQVKEKFGGLRFYVYGHNERISGMINMAESMSYKICEICGQKGILRKGSWLRTLCDEHSEGKESYS